MPANPITQLLEQRKQSESTQFRAGTSITTETIPADVTSLVSDILTSGQAAQDANTELVRKVTALSVQSEEEQAKVSQSQRAIASQEAKAALEVQQAVRNVFDAGGGVEMLTSLAAVQAEQMNFALKQNRQVARLDDKSVEKDGVLSTFGAQILLPRERREAQQANKRVQDTAQLIKTVEATTTSTANTMATVAELRTDATVDAIDTQMEAQAAIEKLSRSAKLAETNAKAINENFKLTTQEVAAIVSLKTEERLAQQATAAARALNLEQASNDEIARVINIDRAVKGANLVTGTWVGAAKTVAGPEWDAVKRDFQSGTKKIFKDPRDALSIGNNTAEAVRISVLNDSSDLATNVPRNKFLQRTSKRLEKLYEKQGKLIADVDPVSREKDYNELAITDAQDELDLIPAGGEGLYSAIPYPTLSQAASIQSTKLHQKVLVPLDLQKTDEQQILNLASAALRKKGDEGLSIQEFVDGITSIFQFAKLQNNTINQYTKYHLPEQEAYPFEVAVGVSGRTEEVDLSDPTQVRNVAAKLLTEELRRQGAFSEVGFLGEQRRRKELEEGSVK